MLLKRLKYFIDRRKLKNNILSVSIGNTVAQIISFVTLIITTKIFTQSDFGDLAVVVGIAGILRVIITLRYETLIVPSITMEESKKKHFYVYC